MMNHKFTAYALLCTLILFGCVSAPSSVSVHTLPPEHQWSQQDLSVLKSLSLNSLAQKHDKYNKYASHPDAVKLGHKLFFDTRFSANGKISCATCHDPKKYFTDGLKVARGIDLTTRNTPTIVGASQQHWFFHDGRADSLWSQALGPLENQKEHGGNRTQYVKTIHDDIHLRDLYEKVFGPLPDLSDKNRFPVSAGPLGDSTARQAWAGMKSSDQQIITTHFVNIGKSLAAYEQQLQPAGSRFDNYVDAALRNDHKTMMTSLTNDEAAGLKIFTGKGTCVICHNGPMFSDGEFHNINTVDIQSNLNDVGRYEGAKQVLNNEFNCQGPYNDAESNNCPELEYIVLDKHETVGAFKTPGLRNVAKTAPYMHDGQYQTLEMVLKHYNKPPSRIIGQTGLLVPIDLTDDEISKLEAFLITLNSEIKAPPSLLISP